MEIPLGFKAKIANVFYDKTVGVVSRTETTEADGAVTTSEGAVNSTFKGNARLVNLKQVQKDFGLDYQIDISISAGTDLDIATGTIIEYDGQKFTVTDVIPTDSHTTIVGVKWRSLTQ
jgi:hypothetical protein